MISTTSQEKVERLVSAANEMSTRNTVKTDFAYKGDSLSLVRKLRLGGNVKPEYLKRLEAIENLYLNRNDFNYPNDYATVARASNEAFTKIRKRNLYLSLSGRWILTNTLLIGMHVAVQFNKILGGLGVFLLSRKPKKIGSRFILPWFLFYSLMNYSEEYNNNGKSFTLNRRIGERFSMMMHLEGDHNLKI